jgi:hypothetical protein
VVHLGKFGLSYYPIQFIHGIILIYHHLSLERNATVIFGPLYVLVLLTLEFGSESSGTIFHFVFQIGSIPV